MKVRLSNQSGVGQLLVGNLSVTRQGTFDEGGQPGEISQEDFDRLKDQYGLEEYNEAEGDLEVSFDPEDDAHKEPRDE